MRPLIPTLMILTSIQLTGMGFTFAQTPFQSIQFYEAQSQTQKNEIQRQRVTLEKMTSQIQQSKKNSTTIFSKLWIQKNLKDAQSLSQKIENLQFQQDQTLQTIFSLKQKRLIELDNQMVPLTKQDSPQALSRMTDLLNEKSQLVSYLFFNPHHPPRSFEYVEPQVLASQINQLESLRNVYQKQLAILTKKSLRKISKRWLDRERTHFNDEEHFFGEQSFIANGSTRNANQNPQLLRNTQTNSDENINTPATPSPSLPNQTVDQPIVEPIVPETQHRRTDQDNFILTNQDREINTSKPMGIAANQDLQQTILLTQAVLNQIDTLNAQFKSSAR